MIRATFTCLLLSGFFALPLTVSAAETENKITAPRPNILYFYVDDMGWGSGGPNGQADRKAQGLPYLLTPTLDRLAAEGLAFDAPAGPRAVLAGDINGDGDADRIGMYDETGAFVDSHKILALLIKYLSQEKGLDGIVVKTFSTTDMLQKMADAYGREAVTAPIGFKYNGTLIVDFWSHYTRMMAMQPGSLLQRAYAANCVICEIYGPVY